MITVAARVAIKPEMREKALAAASRMTVETHKEAGCLQYHFYTDIDDPNVLHVFEEWESDSALNAHLQTPHMAEFSAVLGQVVAEEPKVMRYVVSERTRLM
jgi:quinol monooxygenase YgiN